MSEFQLRIDSVVSLTAGNEAVLRYIGPIKDKKGVFAGLELRGDLSGKGKNSGDANGVHYFDTSIPMSGLFLPYSKLVQYNTGVNGTIISNVGGENGGGGRSGGGAGTPSLLFQDHFSSPRSGSIHYSNALHIQKKSPLIGSGRKLNHGEFDIPDTESGLVLHLKSEIETLRSQNREYSDNAKLYEVKLAERTKILQDLESTISSFDPMLADYDKELQAKDDKFRKYKESSDKQIKELLDAIELLEQQSNESQEMYTKKLKELEVRASEGKDTSGELNEKIRRIEQLQGQLEAKEESFKEFKASTGKEINEMRKFEMQNYTLSLKLEKLENAKGSGDVSIEKVKKMEEENGLLEEKVREVETVRKRLEVRLKESERGRKELGERVEELENTKNEHEEKVMDLERTKNEQEEKVKDLEKTKDEQAEKIEDLERTKNEQAEKVKDLEKTKNEQEEKVKELESSMTEKEEKVKKMEEAIEKQEKKIELDKSISGLTDGPRIQILEKEHEDKEDSLYAALTKKDSKIKKLQKKLKEKDQVIEENNRILREKQQEVAEKEKQILVLTAANEASLAIQAHATPGSLVTANGDLKVYEPEHKADPSAGRIKWCGLCERQGHDSIDCPYENDVF
ncbi:DEKNAAC100189 [Brettanomyces naardenensis]|uniref:DEKNAAC100189 n=1 Tax=Brettanomyces naardenensis TaxID=13370 RepID=A0A448YFL2_BRENA|nr:DEKNAAC100189 [Brettanomyces naardenensis]